jgi:hypothetical protein
VKRFFVLPAMAVSLIGATLTGTSGPAQAASTDVGVIPATRSCPAGSEPLVISMDDEDRSNANAHEGNIGAIRSTTNTEFYFCRVNGSAFRAFNPDGAGARPYAVLKLGSNCPHGSGEFSRHFDNEDNSNDNSYSGNIFPNRSTTNTRLVFCLFNSHASSTMTAFPNLGYQYNVLSRLDAQGSIRTDDEDSNNANSYDAAPGIGVDARTMVSDGPNTEMRFRVAR